MVAEISLLDAIGNSTSTYDGVSPAELQVRLANELVAAALDKHRHIEALDACGPTKKWRRLYVRETEAAMRQVHEEWLGPAQALLRRVREMAAGGRTVEKLKELESAVLLVRGLLMMTVEQIEAAREDARRGNVVSVEEVRRELRARAAS